MTRLTIVQMNDSHAYFEQHPELFWAGRQATYPLVGGYARIATLLSEIRAETAGSALVLDCGDTIHGTYAAVETQGEALIPILRHLNFDAWTGHWDFAYGPDRLRQVAKQLPYPFLAINCYDEESGELVFDPYRICEINGLRIAIIGLAAYIVDQVMPASFSRGIRLTLGKEELPSIIDRVRREEGADLVVVISHLGFPQEVKLAHEVEGIDVLLSAHTHNRLWAPVTVNQTIIMQSGSHGSFLGRLTLEVEDGRVRDFRHRLLVVDETIKPDLQVAEMVEAALGPYRDMLAERVGKTETDLNRDRVLEATMDNLLLQSLLHVTDAELAFSNGWRYGAPIPAGPITMNDLYNMIPMNPPISTTTLTGDELWAMLEHNLEHTFSRDPYQQLGGYVKRCMGLTVYVKIENPPGRRIQELFVRGAKVQPDREYQAAFVTTQAIPVEYGQRRQSLMPAIDALRHYLTDKKVVTAELQGTVVAV